jgi:hypothetical protein
VVVVEGLERHVEGDVGRQGTDHEGDGSSDDDEDARHEEAREEPRNDQEVDRVGGAHPQRVHLLGDDHRADLGRDACAHARREHERADRRGEVAHEQLEVGRAEHRVVGHHALGLDSGLVDEDHPHEAHRDAQEEERTVPELVHLLERRALLAASAEGVVERADEDRVELAPADQQIDSGRPQRSDGAEVLVVRGLVARVLGFGVDLARRHRTS